MQVKQYTHVYIYTKYIHIQNMSLVLGSLGSSLLVQPSLSPVYFVILRDYRIIWKSQNGTFLSFTLDH